MPLHLRPIMNIAPPPQTDSNSALLFFLSSSIWTCQIGTTQITVPCPAQQLAVQQQLNQD